MSSHTLWLASFPKSGNTWVRAQLDALVRKAQPDFAAMDRDEAHDRMDPALDLALGELAPDEAAAAIRLSWAIAEPAHTGFIRRKTHSAWLPSVDAWPIPWQPQGARVIYIIRDPRAVVTSWAHHLNVTPATAVEIMGDEERALRADHMADGRGLLSSWSAHVTSWVHQCHLPLLLVHYEQMLADPIGELTRMAEFAQIEATADDIAAASAACSFATLAAREIFEGFPEAAGADRAFFRRGEAQGWRTELAPELADAVVTRHGQVMREFGYLPKQ